MIEHKKDSNIINQTFIQNFQMYHYFSELNIKNDQNQQLNIKKPENYNKIEQLMKKKKQIKLLNKK
jgi:hypothetical protein